jgi:hypothetical protein
MNRLGFVLLALALPIFNGGCVGITSAGNRSGSSATSITAQPIGQTVMAGQKATFSVAATGKGFLTYRWRKNTVPISGATSPAYTTPPTSDSDNGAQFTVVVASSAAGSVTSNVAMLTVNPLPAAPSITAEPANQTVMAGQTATFSVSATGAGPLTYQWHRNGMPIGGATSSSYTTAATTISENGAQFTVSVSNIASNVTSNAAILTVTATPVGPSITTQPASQTVTAGQTTNFSVRASGTAPLSYQWHKNGAIISSAISANYTTPGTTAADTGAQFTVVVSNSVGSVTSSAATLTVNAAPVALSIMTQPISQTVNAGQTATFSVTASGAAPLSYQWHKNGADVSGGTSASYTTPAATTADTGAQFTVVVSNSTGSITSNAAILTVDSVTHLLGVGPTSLSFGNTNTGASSTLAVTLTNSGNSNVTISNVSFSGAGFNPSGVSAGTILTPGQTATLNVTFAPAATGSVAGNVTVTSNAQNSPAIISLSGVGVTPTSSAFTAWVASGLVRVGPTDAPGTASSIGLSGARGETVDTHVIVRGPAGGLSNVNLSASALIGPGGATIAASNVVLYREYYTTVSGTVPQGGFPSGGTNPPLGSGTYAEPLIPFVDPETGGALNGSLKAVPATVAANQNQPFWVDISIPRGKTNSPPGLYTGTINVTSSLGNLSIPVAVTVWNFELPMKPSELSEWTLWNPSTGNTVATLAQALMRNKVMSRYDDAVSAVTDMATLGMNRVGLDGSFYIGMQCNGAFSSLPSQAQIAAAAATFPLGLPLDEYVADELNGCGGDYTNLKTLARNLHANGVKSIATFNAIDPNLMDDGNGILPAIDHWVLLTAMEQWPAIPYTGKGDLWTYTSCNIGFGNAPEWLIDYPPINERIQAGFLNWMEGATGVLYYRADGWSSGNAIGSWDNLNVSACGSGTSNPGDGVFVYPGGPVGSSEPVPGIRLKAIRDGIQDYEYVQILKSLGQGAFASSVIQPIASSWSNWSHDHGALESARLQLGQMLNQLSPP